MLSKAKSRISGCRKIVVPLLAIVMAIAFVQVAQASAPDTDTFTINVSVQRDVGVNVSTDASPDARDIFFEAAISSHNMATNARVVIPQPLIVWNISPVHAASVQNYSLQVTGDTENLLAEVAISSWPSSGGSGAVDRYILAGVFMTSTGTATADSFLSGSAEDVILSGQAKSWDTGGFFDPAVGGYATPARHPKNPVGSGGDLRLWIGVATPSATTSVGQGTSFTVTVTALP